jgi:hypothetical protein
MILFNVSYNRQAWKASKTISNVSLKINQLYILFIQIAHFSAGTGNSTLGITFDKY